jgi:hypothetical protein
MAIINLLEKLQGHVKNQNLKDINVDIEAPMSHQTLKVLLGA